MKRRLVIWGCTVVLAFLSFACKDTGGGRSAMLQAVTGGTSELLVVMSKERWEGAMGDTIRSFFGQPQLGLPQGEPVFDVISLPLANFDKSVRAHRNVLMVSITGKTDTATFQYFDSPWARSQKLFKISAPSPEAFYKAFDSHKETMMGIFLKAERERLIDVYKKSPNEKVFNCFKNNYDVLLYCPGGYNINKDTCGFVWSSYETRVDSRGFMFFADSYTDESQFDFHIILDRVNEQLKKYIPGPLDSTWMALDMVTPMTAANYRYEGKHYALQVKGLWLVENDYMGGPFILNVVLDEQRGRIIYMLGYVYAPDGKKRNLLRQVESILYSMRFDFPEEEQKEKKQE